MDLEQIERMYEEGDLILARDATERKKDIKTRLLHSKVLESLGELDRAMNVANELISKVEIHHPLRPVILLHLAFMKWRTASYKESKQVLDEIEYSYDKGSGELTPGMRGDISYIRALINHSLSQLGAALVAARKAHDTYQKEGDHYQSGKASYLLGRIYYSKMDESNVEKYFEMTKKIAEEHRFQEILCDVYHELALFYTATNKRGLSKESIEMSLKLSQKISYKPGIARAFHRKGQISLSEGKLDKALQYTKKSADMRTAMNDRYNLGISYLLLGTILKNKSEYQDSLDVCLAGLKIFEKLGEKTYRSRILITIGITYGLLGELDKCLRYYFKALKIMEEINDTSGIILVRNYIANFYQQTGDLKRALQYYAEVLDYQNQYGNEVSRAKTKINLGIVHQLKGELNKAIGFFNAALEVFSEQHNPVYIAKCYFYLGISYKLANRVSRAEEIFEKAVTLYREIGNELFLAQSLFHLIDLLDTQPQKLAIYHSELNSIGGDDQKSLDLMKRLADAIKLKSGRRIYQKVDAQRIFDEVAKDEVVDFDLTVFAIYHLCDLLIDELKTYGHREVLEEINTHLNHLIKVGKRQKSYFWQVQALITQARLYLVQGNLDEAYSILDEGINISDTHDLGALSKEIRKEKETIQDNIREWEILLEKNKTFKERLESEKMKEFLNFVVNFTR